MMIGICPVCNKTDVQLSRDHIIPKALIRLVFGSGVVKNFLTKKEIDFVKKNNIRIICVDCNNRKGGNFEMVERISNVFYPKLIRYLEDMRDKSLASEPTVIEVKCCCHKCG